jgi:hypothetical protein
MRAPPSLHQWRPHHLDAAQRRHRNLVPTAFTRHDDVVVRARYLSLHLEAGER